MKTISFAWTTPALLAGRKTCTRRQWKDHYARTFRQGEMVAAYDRQPRYGGKHVATIRLTADPIKQSSRQAPEDDYQAEGFDYLAEIGAKVDGLDPYLLWRVWRMTDIGLWVVRFELVEIVLDAAH